ncbi:hypothetical protein CFC21_049819 [Triticum aestivum]|uniref:Uncharacterized protein n=2 Tax=Triticum aestivum TaxID=4565 RepID=A0A3B6H593_WHEAT|nr:hypothetical protein CFC21_049819 [Triticum aestivum]
MFHVLYEMSCFCTNYDTIGHVTKQCMDGVHDPKKFRFGNFMMVPT